VLQFALFQSDGVISGICRCVLNRKADLLCR